MKWWEDYAAEDGRPALLGDMRLLVRMLYLVNMNRKTLTFGTRR